jgi:hypothetical protein
MVAGATSEGGASVAFPVMTLVFGIAPVVARDFSFMIQSVGMTCASFTILYMGTLPCCAPLALSLQALSILLPLALPPVVLCVFPGVLIEWKAVVYTTIGGVVGIIFGLEYFQLTPPYAKM